MKDSARGVMDLAASVGKPMMAMVSSILTALDPIISKVKNWIEGNKSLVKTVLKITFAIGAFLFVTGALALIMGVTASALSALSPLLLLVTGRFGLMSAASWLVNASLLANPIMWVVLGVMALVAVLGTLIYYWEEVSTWLGVVWDNFLAFTGLGNLLLPIGEYFRSFVEPIMTAIDLVDQFVQRLDVAAGISGIVSDVSGAVSSWFGADSESQLKVDNINKSHSIIDVNIVSPEGMTTESTAQSTTGGVTLRTIDNGIS
jgi:hypothetical protein